MKETEVLLEIKARAKTRLKAIERKNNLESLVFVSLVGMEETEEGRIEYSVTISVFGEPLRFKSLGLTPEKAVDHCLSGGFLSMLRIQSQSIREGIKKLLA